MYGLAVNLSISLSGHPWIINEIESLESHLTSDSSQAEKEMIVVTS